MPIAVVQSVGNEAIAATVAVSFASLPAVGRLVVVVVSQDGSAPGATSVTDNQGHTYAQHVVSGGTGNRTAWYSTTVTASSGTFTVTATRTSGSSAINACAVDCSAPAASSQYDVSATNTGTSAAASSGTTAATAVADSLAVAAMSNQGGLNPSTTGNEGGWTVAREQENGASFMVWSVVYKVLSATGTQSHAWTNEPADWGAGVAVFKGTAAAAKAYPFRGGVPVPILTM